jgi:hypothetical protein
MKLKLPFYAVIAVLLAALLIYNFWVAYRWSSGPWEHVEGEVLYFASSSSRYDPSHW